MVIIKTCERTPDAWLKTNVFIIIGPGTAPLTNLSRELSPVLSVYLVSYQNCKAGDLYGTKSVVTKNMTAV